MGYQVRLMDEGWTLETEVDTAGRVSRLLECSLCTCEIRMRFPQERLPDPNLFPLRQVSAAPSNSFSDATYRSSAVLPASVMR